MDLLKYTDRNYLAYLRDIVFNIRVLIRICICL